MAHALSNKALTVLALLREQGELTCMRVSELVTERTPCGRCNGTGAGDDERYGCRPCYGRGRALMQYGTAYVALQQLRKRGLVERRHLVDEWGDPTPTLVWFAAAAPDPDD